MKKEEVKKDLDFICAQTNAWWLCYDDIHTLDAKADVEKFIKAYEWCGYSKQKQLENFYLIPEYGGGLTINHSNEVQMAGYTITSKDDTRSLVVLSGFDLPLEYQTAYHEAGHLYQVKHNLFPLGYKNPYGKYLMEIHAETFSSMVILLKSKNVIDYKRTKLRCFLNSADRFYDKNKTQKNMVYYMSLPIELEMMRDIRKKGRKNVRQSFLKDGHLDFEGIAFYCADLVKKHAYSREEFLKIFNDKNPPKYAMLKRRVKTWRIIGEFYNNLQWRNYANKTFKHIIIERKRNKKIKEALLNLCENNKENKIINAACAIDTYYVLMQRSFGVQCNLDRIVQTNKKVKNLADDDSFDEIRIKMKDLFSTWKKEPYFMALYEKIKSYQTRDEVWQLKDQKMAEYKKVRLKLNFAEKTR